MQEAPSEPVFDVERRAEDMRGTATFETMTAGFDDVELEIGSGKGRFLIRCAQAMPGTYFIGIERANRFFKIARERANRRRLANVCLVRADAYDILHESVPEAGLGAVHVLFPDPWPKKRHHKRRLFQPEFLELVERVLRDGGTLNVATDHADYFRAIDEVVSSRPRLTPDPGFELTGRLPDDEIGHTNYEVKYRLEGRLIKQRTWLRRARGAAH